MTPYEQVSSNYQLPFQLYPFQQDIVNQLGPLPRAGYWMDTGTGKTATATVAALYRGRQTLILLPPILGPMWRRWLTLIPGVSVTLYGGKPADRAQMKLDADFVIMSIHIFKRDYDSVVARLNKRLTVIVDEATTIKNVTSDNHKAVYDLIFTHKANAMLLSGTPLSTPVDVYAYAKLLNTGAYRNFRHWCNLHVEAYDFYGNIAEYKNLVLMYENMNINSVRVLKEDVLKYLPTVTFTPMPYVLDHQHYRLYKKLATEEILELENSGSKIDATVASALFHALGQIVVNWGHFADDDSKVGKGVELVEEILAELGTGKLVVFSNYRLTNRLLMEKLAVYNPVAIYGDVSQAEQQRSVARFIDDLECRVLIANLQSAGYGIDGLQGVCSTALFLEMPAIPAQLAQAVARLHRNGQQNPVQVYLAVAEQTLQVRQMNSLLDKDHLVNMVIRNVGDLRDAIFGV